MNKLIYLIPLIFLPLTVYATDQTLTTNNIFNHVNNFKISDKLIIQNNDTNFSHSIKAINKQGYTRSTPSIFPQTSYGIQFEQPGNYTVYDEMNPSNIGYINVLPYNTTTGTVNQSISSMTTSTISFGVSNSTNIASSFSSTNSDVSYWKSQAMTWKFIAEQLQQKLDSLNVAK